MKAKAVARSSAFDLRIAMAGALAAAGLLMLAFSGQASGAPKVGEPAPDFSLVDSNGEMHKLSDFKGKTVVLEWTNHGCPFVKKHYETNNMQTLQKDTTQDGVVWLTVISSAPGTQGHVDGSEANQLTTQRDASPTAVLLDPEGIVGRRYDARTTPQMFIIGEDGMLRYQGAIDDQPSTRRATVATAKNYVRAAFEDMEAGRPIQTAVTRPYGCSVKYAY